MQAGRRTYNRLQSAREQPLVFRSYSDHKGKNADTLEIVLGKPMLTENAVVKEVAEKLNATPAQVLIAWCAHRGYSVIPKSVQESEYNERFL